MLVVKQAKSEAEISAVQDLIREFTSWAFSFSDSAVEAPTFKGLEEELATLPGIYAPPPGRLLLATRDGQPAGCVALKPHNAGVSELKRMYVRPAFRGQGIGKQLARRLIEEARLAGYERIVLDSHRSMTTAHAIYESLGFRRVEAPGDFPEEFKPHVVFMEMDLAQTGATTGS